MSYYEKYLGNKKWELKASEIKALREKETMIGVQIIVAFLNGFLLIPSVIGYFIFNYKIFLFFGCTSLAFGILFWIMAYLTHKGYRKELDKIKERGSSQSEATIK